MASSSSSSCKYDVFLSFRGEDTRKIFVCHLYEALKQKAINAYIDSADLEKGNKISELLTAIENSRISIVVLSQDYASSKWCLRELAKIMECMDNKEQIVLPVFYEVDPSDVRNIGGTFAQAFAKHGETSDLGQEELKSWRSALTRVADLSGWDSQRYEEDAKLIMEVVESTSRKLTHTWSDKANRGLVGMDSHIAEMYSRLCLDVNDVRVVVIWGMGGLGKTTIATAVYDEIACQFEHSCFVDNVKQAFIDKREAELQRNFLSDLLKEKVQSMDLRRGRNMIMKRLGSRKVLVVLDDVGTFSQIEDLLGEPHEFGEGSRIIITTRNKQALDDDVDATYQPKCLYDEESRELLRKHAFRTKQPSEEYSDLINQAIEYAQGLPLALKVLGSSLYKKSIQQWIDLLEKIKIMPQRGILDLLKTSFDELDDFDKNIFLDIACFYRGWNQDHVTDLLHGFSPHIGLPNLVDRALITISGDNILDMHDLLQELGREIVQRYSIEGPIKEPGKRSRLWSYEDINHVLTQNTATDTIECLVLELPTAAHPYCINIGAFVRMTKLRALTIYNEASFSWDGRKHFTSGVLKLISHELRKLQWHEYPWYGRKHVTSGVLELLSHELRLLEWHEYPLETLPSSFVPRNLVRLDMRGSRIVELWEENKLQPLQHLKEIWLSGCESLVKIPDLTNAIHLKKLYLEGCSSLRELHPSISALQELEYLTLVECEQLEILPSSLHMRYLKTLNLSGCSNLEKFPEISDVMSRLQQLDLNGTAIKELHSSINNLTGLRLLNLSNCKELTTLPSSIYLSSLESIHLTGCSSLEKFPEISDVMPKLQQLYLAGTAIKELPSSIDQLQGLKQLTMRNCKSLEILPDSMCNLADLTHLDLSGCSTLHNLPEKLGDLKSLACLRVEESGLKHFPHSIVRWYRQLETVSFEGFNDTVATHLSSWSSFIGYYGFSVLVHLDLSDCNLLELPDSVADLSSLKTLKLCRNNFESLPVTMDRLGCLTHLELKACKKLKSIPELPSINYIDAHCCTALETVSTPKTGRTILDFRFSNCFRLIQTNLFTDFLHQGYHPQPLSWKMCSPGSDIPNWFSHQSMASSVTVQLPRNWFDKMFLGFAICTVSCFNEADPSYAPHLATLCYCTFKGNHGEHKFSVHLRDWGLTGDDSLQLDHLFMEYVSWSKFSLAEKGEPVNERYYTEATFKIVVESICNSRSERHCMTSYGVRFFHESYMDVHNESMTHLTDHVELGASSFPDQLEIRSETEWEAESSEMAAGRGTCGTLELLTEPQTDRKEEHEIMVVVEQGEVCRVSGSVCCCLSLSGCSCTMSFE